jgi:hypothetical protein
LIYDSRDDDDLFLDYSPDPWNESCYSSAFNHQFKLNCLVGKVNPVCLRSHVGIVKDETLSLIWNGETKILKRNRVVNIDLIVNNENGCDVPIKDKSKVELYIAPMNSSENPTKFFSQEEKLIGINIRITQLCGEITARKIPCKNRTKHPSGKCHYHRHL